MPLTKIAFKPGIVKDDTSLASEGGWVDSSRVRFRRGQPEVIGGWQLKVSLPFSGIARGVHAWTDLAGTAYTAWGTAANLYVLVGGALLDITPPLATGVLKAPFATVNGSPTVTVTNTGHGLASGDTVVLSNATPIAGLTLNGTFPVTRTTDDAFTIQAGSNATATTSSGPNDTVDFLARLPAGNVDGVVAGYGTGPYGSGPYGGSSLGDTEPRIWSLDNFGETLLANPRGRGLYQWQPSFQAPQLITNGDFSTTAGWAAGTGWAISGGSANATAGSASGLAQTLGTITGGKVYRVTFTATVTAGTLKVQANAGTPSPALVDIGLASTPITRSGTYSRTFLAPAGTAALVFSKDASFAGSIDNVAVSLETSAYRIDEAPRNIDYMWVDADRFVMTLATQQFDGTYNPLLVRWSDQENVRQWDPTANSGASLSGELPLSHGSRVLTGLAGRQQNLIWTDSALFTLTFTADTSLVFVAQLVGTGCGIIGRNAAVERNGTAYWLSRSGFYAYGGGVPQPIPCSLERDAIDHIAPLQEEKVFAGINGKFSEVMWFVPDVRDGVECSRAVVFNFTENVWMTHMMPRSAWLDAEFYEYPTGFGVNSMVYDHEVGQTDNGAALGWHLTSAAFDLGDGDQLEIVKAIIPDVQNQEGGVTYALTPRMYPNAPDLPTTQHIAQPDTQALRMRRKGRQMALTIQSSDAPSFWRLGALRLDLEQSGAKR